MRVEIGQQCSSYVQRVPSRHAIRSRRDTEFFEKLGVFDPRQLAVHLGPRGLAAVGEGKRRQRSDQSTRDQRGLATGSCRIMPQPQCSLDDISRFSGTMQVVFLVCRIWTLAAQSRLFTWSHVGSKKLDPQQPVGARADKIFAYHRLCPLSRKEQIHVGSTLALYPGEHVVRCPCGCPGLLACTVHSAGAGRWRTARHHPKQAAAAADRRSGAG